MFTNLYKCLLNDTLSRLIYKRYLNRKKLMYVIQNLYLIYLFDRSKCQ